MSELRIGTVEHYYPKAHAAVVRIEDGLLRVGDQVHIVGAHDDFWEEVTSLQVDHAAVPKAAKGASVGLWVEQPVHAGAEVFRLDALES
jgi:putative protease